jgi:prepilin-type N-terminal cleavage/methylation domain-containing protein
MQNQVKKTQSGYSLVELSISLAIVGVVIAGSIVGVTSILRNNNVNKTIAQTNNATNKIVGRLARDTTYASATTANLSGLNQEIWEAGQIPAVGDVQHFFGNRVHVAPLAGGAFGTDANQGYVYSLAGVPLAACQDLAVGLETLATAMSITRQAPPPTAPVAIAVAGLVKQPGTPFTTAQATTACNTGTGQTVTVSLLVPRR